MGLLVFGFWGLGVWGFGSFGGLGVLGVWSLGFGGLGFGLLKCAHSPPSFARKMQFFFQVAVK